MGGACPEAGGGRVRSAGGGHLEAGRQGVQDATPPRLQPLLWLVAKRRHLAPATPASGEGAKHAQKGAQGPHPSAAAGPLRLRCARPMPPRLRSASQPTASPVACSPEPAASRPVAAPALPPPHQVCPPVLLIRELGGPQRQPRGVEPGYLRLGAGAQQAQALQLERGRGTHAMPWLRPWVA